MLETKPKVCGSVGTLLLQFRLFAWSVDKSLVKLSASWQILQNSIPSELSSATNPKCGFLLMYLWGFFLACLQLHITAWKKGRVLWMQRERTEWPLRSIFKLFQKLKIWAGISRWMCLVYLCPYWPMKSTKCTIPLLSFALLPPYLPGEGAKPISSVTMLAFLVGSPSTGAWMGFAITGNKTHFVSVTGTISEAIT